MKLNAGRVLLLAVTAALATGCGQQLPRDTADGSVQSLGRTAAQSGRYTVVFRSDRLPVDAASRITGAGAKIIRKIDSVGIAIVSATPQAAAKLAKDAAVLGLNSEHMYSLPQVQEISLDIASPDAATAPTSKDNLYYYQWDMRRIGAPAVWERFGANLPSTTVAVLDTGVMHDHPDLAGQVNDYQATNYCQESGGTPAKASYPIYSKLIDFDATPEWDPTVNTCTPANVTYQAHGTHVSGTIAAKFDGGRVVGIAPSLKIAAYKVFDRYRYTDDAGKLHDGVGGFDGPIFEAIVDAVNKGYKVISMSLGSTLDRSKENASYVAWDRVAKYANNKGTLIVASAGNDAENSNGAIAHIPSDISTIMSVSASNSSSINLDSSGNYVAAVGSDTLASYSNYGASTDIAAPGGDCGPDGCLAKYFILNTIIRADGSAWYGFYAGTSMATPHVSGVAALVSALHPTWTAGQLRAYLGSTADDFGSARQYLGHGILNADAAVR